MTVVISRIALLLTFVLLLAACSPLDSESLGVVAQPIYDATDQTQDHLSFTCSSGAAVTVKGTSGATLAAGTKVTGSAVRDIVLENDVVKITHELQDTSQRGAHYLYRRTDFSPHDYVQAVTAYGDWTFYAAGFQDDAVEAHVLTSNGDVVEVAFVFDHYLDQSGTQDALGYVPHWTSGSCTLPSCGCYLSGCGVTERDEDGVGIRISPYCSDPECLRRVHRITFVKMIRLERCAEGYFAGYHTDPVINPKNGLAGNNENSYGEREFGTGNGNAVTWSSAGNVFRHPGRGQHDWLGIDDPTYLGSWPNQYMSFPAEQTTGPWWAADLPYYNASGVWGSPQIPFVRYIVLEHRLETGIWAFSTNALGSTVVHFVNDETEASGMPTKYQMFLGAMPYVTDDETACSISGLSGTWRCYPNEPKSSTTTAIQNRMPLSWPH